MNIILWQKSSSIFLTKSFNHSNPILVFYAAPFKTKNKFVWKTDKLTENSLFSIFFFFFFFLLLLIYQLTQLIQCVTKRVLSPADSLIANGSIRCEQSSNGDSILIRSFEQTKRKKSSTNFCEDAKCTRVFRSVLRHCDIVYNCHRFISTFVSFFCRRFHFSKLLL